MQLGVWSKGDKVHLKFTTIIANVSDLLTPSHKSALPTHKIRSAEHLTTSLVCATKGQRNKSALPTHKIRPADHEPNLCSKRPRNKSALPTHKIRPAEHFTMSQACAAKGQQNKSALPTHKIRPAEHFTMSQANKTRGQQNKWALPTHKIRPTENSTMSPICALRGWWRSRCFFGGIMSCSTSLWGSMISVTVWPVVLASRPSEDIACNAQVMPNSKPLLQLVMP